LLGHASLGVLESAPQLLLPLLLLLLSLLLLLNVLLRAPLELGAVGALLLVALSLLGHASLGVLASASLLLLSLLLLLLSLLLLLQVLLRAPLELGAVGALLLVALSLLGHASLGVRGRRLGLQVCLRSSFQLGAPALLLPAVGVGHRASHALLLLASPRLGRPALRGVAHAFARRGRSRPPFQLVAPLS
ncbi:MAG: hypothetical protein AB7S26_40755, partial [Sandaracinaceae bacterium]